MTERTLSWLYSDNKSPLTRAWADVVWDITGRDYFSGEGTSYKETELCEKVFSERFNGKWTKTNGRMWNDTFTFETNEDYLAFVLRWEK